MNAEASYLPQAHSDLVPGRDQTLRAVDDLLAERLAQLRGVLADAGCDRIEASPTLHIDLIDELELRLGDPGKRLRPSLAHRGWVLSGGDRRTWSTLVQVAAAMELLHLFGLVHDDIMDRSSTRRGRQTLHVSSASNTARPTRPATRNTSVTASRSCWAILPSAKPMPWSARAPARCATPGGSCRPNSSRAN